MHIYLLLYGVQLCCNEDVIHEVEEPVILILLVNIIHSTVAIAEVRKACFTKASCNTIVTFKPGSQSLHSYRTVSLWIYICGDCSFMSVIYSRQKGYYMYVTNLLGSPEVTEQRVTIEIKSLQCA